MQRVRHRASASMCADCTLLRRRPSAAVRHRRSSAAVPPAGAAVARRMRTHYADAMLHVHEALPSLHQSTVDRRGVFANNELDLASVQVYGFDYDYTLAVYTFELNRLIYELAVDRLVKDYHYPSELCDMAYDARWAIRGLHIDRATATMVKLDAFCRMQHGTVYRGHRQLGKGDVLELFKRFAIPEQYLEQHAESTTRHNFVQLADLFSLPQAGLVANVVDYFQSEQLAFDPVLLVDDVDSAVRSVHVSGDLYSRVVSDRLRYLHANPGLRDLLQQLRLAGKTLFLLTNSPYSFIAPGLQFMLGNDWRRFFHYVIVQARKPHFFAERNRPFRLLDVDRNVPLYYHVERLEKGRIYTGGNIGALGRLSTIGKRGVIYFGDHISTDLAQPMVEHGWHTGAVVPELEREIAIQNSRPFKLRLLRVAALRSLIERHQREARAAAGGAAVRVLRDWTTQWSADRDAMKALFNRQFGSMFRTYHNPTYFSRRLMRLADVYTSRLPNLLPLGDAHVFQPRRAPLAHELVTPHFY